MKGYRYILALLIVLSACDKPAVTPQEEHFLSNGVLIANEGNFQWGNASVSFYDFENDTVLEKVFQGVNQRPLGDVLQSINIFENKAYMVLNNSGTIEVVDKNSFELEATISGLTSPRYIHFVNSNKAYVSDLYAELIAVIDLNSNEILDYIYCDGWTEEMVQIGSYVFVVNKEYDLVHKINTLTDANESYQQFNFNIASIKVDNQDRLWLCGDIAQTGKVIAMDVNGTILYDYTIEGAWPTDLFVTEEGHDVYFLSDGVWHINEFTDNIVTSPIIPADGRLFYGLSVHEDKIYIADAINYVQKGKVWVYDLQTTLLDEWEVGIIPSEFDFID